MNERVKLPGDERTRLSYALRLARLGLYIAPLMPGAKTPYSGESWSNMRTRDPATIEAWFNDPARKGMNYAVIPGESFVVLDLDVKPARGNRPEKDGIADLDALAAEHDDSLSDAHAQTLTVRTPSGGVHRYFRAPFAVANAHTLPKSIDVRGNEGYVVGPGCHTNHNPVDGTCEGDYVVSVGADIAALPEWIAPRLKQWTPREDRPSYEDRIELINGKAHVDGVELDTDAAMRRASEWLKSGAKPAIEGEGGNSKTFATFAWLRENGISLALALALVRTYYNPRCEPPWSPEELEQICENAYKYAKREVRAQDTMERRDRASEADIIAESTDVATLLAKPEHVEAQPVVASNRLAESASLGYERADFMARKAQPTRFIVGKSFLMEGVGNGLHGAPGMGKGTLICQLAQAITHGVPLFGMSVLKRPVGLVLCEDPEVEIQRRLRRPLEESPEHFAPDVLANAERLLTFPIVGSGYTPIIAAIDDAGNVQRGPFYETLCNLFRNLGPGALWFLDPITTMATLNGNYPAPVRSLLQGVVDRLCDQFGITIVYTVHPSQAALKDGRLTGGNVQWEAASRANSHLAGVYRKGFENRFDGLTAGRTWHTGKGNYNAPDKVSLWFERRLLTDFKPQETAKASNANDDYSDISDALKKAAVEQCRESAESGRAVQSKSRPADWVINQTFDTVGMVGDLTLFQRVLQAARQDGLLIYLEGHGKYAAGFYPAPEDEARRLSLHVKAEHRRREGEAAERRAPEAVEAES